MLLAAAAILSGREVGVLASAFAGLAMMIFEIVEVVVIDGIAGNSLLIAVSLQVFYFVLGLVVFGLAAYLWLTEYRAYHFPTRHVSHA